MKVRRTKGEKKIEDENERERGRERGRERVLDEVTLYTGVCCGAAFIHPKGVIIHLPT